jgi:hypothetical protein
MLIVSNNITSPTGIKAGKPIAKTFKLGAALETRPNKALISSKPIMIGKAITTAPTKISEDHARRDKIISVLKLPEAIGSNSKLE